VGSDGSRLFLINDLIYHYGCEIVYELQKLGVVIADLKLCDSPNNIKNALRTLVAGGASIVTIHQAANFKPPKNLIDFCALSYIPQIESSTYTTNYPYIFCAPSQLKHFKSETNKKICSYREMPTTTEADYMVIHWSYFLNKNFPLFKAT
jgi:hypothetical protein